MRSAARYPVLAFLIVCSAVRAQSPSPVWAPPAFTGRVVDAAGVLSPRAEQELSAQLQALDDASSVQIAVAVVDSLWGMPARAYAQRLGREWGVGQRGLNNGVVVLVAPREGQTYVAVGSGLEWQLPEARVSEIVYEMGLWFRAGEIGSGIRRGVDLLAAAATSVPWDVRYASVSALPANRARAVGAVVAINGVLSRDGFAVEAGRERVALELPAYGMEMGAPGGRVALLGRVSRAVPLTVQVLGITE